MNHSAILYLSTVLIWGTTWYAITFQVGLVAHELSVAYRFALGAALLFAWCAARRLTLRFGVADHLRMATLGALLFGANYVLFYWVSERLTSGLVAVIFSTLVPMNVLNGALLLRRPVSREVLAGGLVGLSGLALVFAPEVSAVAGQAREAMGAIVVGLIATYLASLGQVLAASNQRRGLPVLQTNAWGMAYGALVMSVCALLAGRPLAFDASVGYVASLVYLAVFGSVLAFGCFLTLVGRIGPERAAYATVLFPIVALAISTVLEGYRWNGLSVTGVAMVLAGNLLMLSGPVRRAVTGLLRRGHREPPVPTVVPSPAARTSAPRS